MGSAKPKLLSAAIHVELGDAPTYIAAITWKAWPPLGRPGVRKRSNGRRYGVEDGIWFLGHVAG